VFASRGSGMLSGSWRAESQARASGGRRMRRFGNRRVQRCDVSGPRPGAATMSCVRPRRPCSSGDVRTAEALMLRRSASMFASGVRSTGWMRPRMSPSGRGPLSIARLSSRWLGCFAGWRSRRRVTGSGSEAGVPFNRKRGSLSDQGKHATLRTRCDETGPGPPAEHGNRAPGCSIRSCRRRGAR